MSGKRVVITGGTGFVGANLARRLLADGHNVHLFVREGFRDWRLADVLGEFELHTVGLHDSDSVDAAMKVAKPEQVYHLAVYGAYSAQQGLAAMFETNVRATENLLRASVAAGVHLFVNTGSSSEYGACDHPPAEDERVEPNSHYAITKAAATHLCRMIAAETGLRAPTLRLYSVYGPYEEPTRLMPTLLMRAAEGTLPPLVNPDIERDFVYIEDVIDAYVALARHADTLPEPGRIYNVASGQATTMRELVETARALFAVEDKPVWGSMPDRAWDTTTWVGNAKRIREELSWTARITVPDGLRRFRAWMDAHPKMMETYAALQSGA